jgi:hypothetical protein
MRPKYAPEYIDRLLAKATYQDLVTLSSAMVGCAHSEGTPESASEKYGLPQFAFLFVETIVWCAQAIRSGVWTYYEATPVSRQREMAAALRHAAPEKFALWYERGMRDWRDEGRIADVDNWIETNETLIHDWLTCFVRRNREALMELIT